MSTPQIDVAYIAKLARIDLTEEETALFSKDLDKVLADSQKDRHSGFQSQGHCFAVRRSCFWMRQQVHLMLQPSAGF